MPRYRYRFLFYLLSYGNPMPRYRYRFLFYQLSYGNPRERGGVVRTRLLLLLPLLLLLLILYNPAWFLFYRLQYRTVTLIVAVKIIRRQRRIRSREAKQKWGGKWAWCGTFQSQLLQLFLLPPSLFRWNYCLYHRYYCALSCDMVKNKKRQEKWKITSSYIIAVYRTPRIQLTCTV